MWSARGAAAATEKTVVMCAAGTMPGELHKLWKAGRPGSYHMEYGFSCMGYEIPGAMGIRMAEPAADVICFTGDGNLSHGQFRACHGER